MSTDTPQAPVADPDLTTYVDMKLREMLLNLNCHLIGTIESFDAAKQTASVSINYKLNFAGQLKEYPLLPDVPVFVLGGGNRGVTVPIVKGDTCLVLFNDRNVDNWFATGNVTSPANLRLHDLSDGFALVGFRSLANPVENYSTTDVQLRNAETMLSLGERVYLANAVTNLYQVMDRMILALMALNTVKTGGSAAAEITVAQLEAIALLKASL